MNSWSAQKKIYVSCAVFLSAAVILASFCFILLKKVRQDGESMILKKQEAENFFANWKNIESLKKDYEDSYKAFWEKPSLLTEEKELSFIKSLEDIAKETNIRQGIEILGKKANSAVKTGQTAQESEPLNLKISLWGNFENFIKYLIRLENNPFYNDISLIQINRLGDSEISNLKEAGSGLSPGDISAILNVSVYQKQIQ